MTDEYPMRINKYLAHEGIATRRGADELIVKGKVLVNGRVAVLGEKVNKGDKVEMRGKSAAKKFLYYAFNKPVGVITHSPQLGEKDIRKSVPMDVFPVGRLDKDSSGLIIPYERRPRDRSPPQPWLRPRQRISRARCRASAIALKRWRRESTSRAT